jgi:hypothetical protein
MNKTKKISLQIIGSEIPGANLVNLRGLGSKEQFSWLRHIEYILHGP